MIICCMLLSISVHSFSFIHLRRSSFIISDTTSPSFFQKIGTYIDSLKSKHYRDTVLSNISRANEPSPKENNRMVKSQQTFAPYSGKIIRDIYFKSVPVFGPSDITDTTFSTSSKLINFANRVHFATKEWVIRQALFFTANDTLNAYRMADNERYLRNQPYIEDARIYVENASAFNDSIDILVITKDQFEYGANVSQVSAHAVKASVFNNNLFGDAQQLKTGGLWNRDYHPPWGSETQYRKYNMAGTFTDVAVGYSTINSNVPLDTGVYERSYFLNINRPFFSSWAKLAGGLSVSKNYSMNIHSFSDSVYRNYNYSVVDVWAGYNFLNRFKKTGLKTNTPNLAVALRDYHLNFQNKPDQKIYATDPVYNNHRFLLGQFLVFKEDFFKTNHFFGFGRTEDIPYGYKTSFSFGKENWSGINRFYSSIQLQRFWILQQKSLLSTSLGISSFWHNGTSQDAVIHAQAGYYSQLVNSGWGLWRQFFTLDYLNCPNNFFYKPLNINMENGVWGFKRTTLNGFQRLNLRTETVYYSPIKIYGFKFNFFASLQASQLSDQYKNLFKNKMYAGMGIGVRIRNENLPINTLKIAANYYPSRPDGVRPFYFELTTVSDLRFDIYAITKPMFLLFE